MKDIACPQCAEDTRISGERNGDHILLRCAECGEAWERSLRPVCGQCGGDDLQAVPLAIVEKGRGTQLSVVGTRTIHLCSSCDTETLADYHRNRPNPLMPDQLPTIG